MNRDRDPVGVDPLMHPPVALTLIPFFSEAATSTAHRLSVGYHERQQRASTQVENKLKKKRRTRKK